MPQWWARIRIGGGGSPGTAELLIIIITLYERFGHAVMLFQVDIGFTFLIGTWFDDV